MRVKSDFLDEAENTSAFFVDDSSGIYRKFGFKPRRFTTALSYNGKSDNQAKN
ncbi:MAG: hypothetical protein GPJ04_20585 [Microcystis aeruginosa G13-03]|nr:hypothetical protein [Microcystis aeruginosa G13-03]